jgi:hypothetical protein
MFGDNQAVVNSSTLPEAKLHKQHTLLLYHRVCEAIAAKMIVFIHIDGRINPVDIPSKHGVTAKFGEVVSPCYSGQEIPLIRLSGSMVPILRKKKRVL